VSRPPAGIDVQLPDGTRGLRDVDLDVAEGEILAVVGPNGAGKSTLLMHLNGLLTGIGSVRVLGLEMKRENLSAIRRGVGYVFQDPQDQLFMPTLRRMSPSAPATWAFRRARLSAVCWRRSGRWDWRGSRMFSATT